MKRRKFIVMLIGGAAIAWSVSARAQQTLPVIGFLSALSSGDMPWLPNSLRQALGEAGFIEGQNVAIEYRWAQGRYDRLPVLAAELVERNVDVIYAFSLPAALAAKAATSTIPIVFYIGADPVPFGLVQSFNRPGANITGVLALLDPLHEKRLQLIHELAPDAVQIGVLINPSNRSAASNVEDAEAAARALGLKITVLTASNGDAITRAFAAGREQSIAGLLVDGDPLFTAQTNELVELAARFALPTIYDRRDYVVAGGLISYGPVLAETRRQAATYVGRILKGERPADLPVVQSSRFELVVNLSTAKSLGLTIPSALLGLADEVVE